MQAMNAQDPGRAVRSVREPLSSEELGAYEERLHGLLASLQSEVGQLETGILWASGGDRFQPDDESMDEAELEVGMGALAAAEQVAYEVREALDRIEDGSFGLCTVCGDWIARERLRLVPYASACSSCLARRQGAR
jgi:RNA polymerase-binding transcription factor DksA